MEGLAHAERQESPGLAEASLVRRAREGDRAAFADIVRLYQRKVYAVAMRMTRRHEVADDIVQDTFIRAYRHLDRFEVGRPLAPWLKKIAANLSINYLSAWQRREEPFETETRPDGIPPESASSSGAGAGREAEPDPFRQVSAIEFAQALDDAVSRLPAEQQVVLRLKVVEGMRYEEIAEALDISAGTVMSRLSRARAKLKASLKEHLEP